MFSGGAYDEVKRWLHNFVTSHAKREDPRLEVAMESEGEREGVSYGVVLRRGTIRSPMIDFDYHEVAQQRGSLAWCATTAARVREVARDLVSASRGVRGARTR